MYVYIYIYIYYYYHQPLRARRLHRLAAGLDLAQQVLLAWETLLLLLLIIIIRIATTTTNNDTGGYLYIHISYFGHFSIVYYLYLYAYILLPGGLLYNFALRRFLGVCCYFFLSFL